MTNEERIRAAAVRVATWLGAEERGPKHIAAGARVLGALHGLALVERLGFGGNEMEAASTPDELLAVANALAVGERPPEGRWLAGYYFNSATHRLHTVAENPAGLTKQGKAAQGVLGAMKRDDNAWKHGNDEPHREGYELRTVSAALEAAEAILDALGA